MKVSPTVVIAGLVCAAPFALAVREDLRRTDRPLPDGIELVDDGDSADREADDFERRLEGSAIRRIGYERWLRNLAVALGNAPSSAKVVAALRARADHPSALVRSHVLWALGRHEVPQPGPPRADRE